MRRLPSLVAALLLPIAQPLLLGAAVSTGTLLVSQASAQAQSAEEVAKVAQAITVRIEGATQGSGVLVKREGNRYTVLTAWHVVSGQRPGEELDIYTPDVQRYRVEQGSIKRLGEVDMAMLAFTSSNSYELAQIGDIKSVSMGSPIYVAGFPLPTSAVPTRIFRFLKGDVIANASIAIPNGYALLYSNPTLPGMSGGAALNAQGQLVGIHGQGETDSRMSEQQGIAVKTGTNQAVPISYYNLLITGRLPNTSTGNEISSDDLIAQAAGILAEWDFGQFNYGNKNASFRDAAKIIVDLSTEALRLRPTLFAFALRARASYALGDFAGALADLEKVLKVETNNKSALYTLLFIKAAQGHIREALAQANRIVELYPDSAEAYLRRADARFYVAELDEAIADLGRAIEIDPGYAEAFARMARIMVVFDELRGACQNIFAAQRLGYRRSLDFVSSDGNSLKRLQCKPFPAWIHK